MKRNKPFIGITGSNASGKGEVVTYLQRQGYTPISLSDLLRDILKEQGLPADRVHLTQVGQQQRIQYGPGVLAQRAIDKIIAPTLQDQPETAFVIDSIRHPEEVRILQEHLPSFELWAIDADVDIRFKRSQKRGRNENAETLDDFIAQENQEKTDNPHGQQLHHTASLADHTLINNADFTQLTRLIDDLICIG